MVGFIAGRMVSLFADRLIGTMDDQCRLVCLLSVLSVGR